MLIEVEDELLDEAYIDYFAEVEKTISVIEYRQLRRNWLDYQKCTTDVVGFCKKTKILLRGANRLVSLIMYVFPLCVCVCMCVCVCVCVLCTFVGTVGSFLFSCVCLFI